MSQVEVKKKRKPKIKETPPELKCYLCLKTKSVGEFHSSRVNRSSYLCRECVKRQYKIYRDTNKARVSHLSRLERYKRVYNIDLEEYNHLYEMQEGKCAICKKAHSSKDKRLSVDHNHLTGRVRGLLCFKCNSALGKFNDNPDILANAIFYLTNSN